MKRKGFTLIEILVVITIIAVLTAIGVISYSSMQKNARDARRKGDMKTLQNALEQYYSQNDAKYATAEDELTPFLPGGYPKDPKDPTQTYSRTTFTTTAYCICAQLESNSGNATDANCTFDPAGGGGFYCVRGLQRE